MRFFDYHQTFVKNGRTFSAGILLFVLAMLPACSKPAATAKAAPPPVNAVLVKQENIPVELGNIGVVQSVASVTLQAQVNGIISSVLIKPGEDVRKNQILFILDKRPFVAALMQARATLAQARANVIVAQAKLDGYQAVYVDARADWLRAKKLGASGTALAITQYDAYKSTYDQAKANVADGKASLVAARKAVDSDQALVTTAQINLGYCTIRSPLDGQAGNLQAYAGTDVQANTTNLLVINQMKPIYVSFSLPQSDLYQIRQAQKKNPKLPVFVSTHGEPGQRLEGYLSFINNEVDDSTGSIQLMGTFANAHAELWPGQYVDATLQVAMQKQAVVIPIVALQTGQNGLFVFVIKNNIARMQPVTQAFTYNELAVISKGLTAGETVITDGQESVIPGKPVEVVANGLIAPATGSFQSGASRPSPSATAATSPANKGRP